MCNDREAFRKNSLGPARATVRLCDKSLLAVTQQGVVAVNGVDLSALFIPEFCVSLLSVAQLDSSGMTTAFSSGECTVTDAVGHVVIEARLSQGLYRVNPVDTDALTTMDDDLAMAKALIAIAAARKHSPRKPVGSLLWHRRLAYLTFSSMGKVLEDISQGDLHDAACDICLKAKSKQMFMRTKAARCALPFELVHSDLCGPFKPSVAGSVYYLLYIDDYTRYTEVYFLRSKAAAEVIPKFRLFKARVEGQGYQIRRFRCDNGRGEYSNEEFLSLLGQSGISFEPSPPYSQHKNGVSE